MNERLYWILGGLGLGAVLLALSRTAAASTDSGAAAAADSSTPFFPDVFAVISGQLYSLTPETQANEKKYLPLIQAAEIKYGLPTDLLHRQLYEESHYRTDIISGATVSSAGAVGIAQLVPRWHPNVNAYDPVASIDYAANFMRQLYNQFGTWSAALAAYNWGPGNVAANGIENLPPETAKYVADITSAVGVA